MCEIYGLDKKKVKIYPYASEAEWREIRRKGITGTDISVIMGTNPYMTQAQLVENKLFGTRKEETEAMFWGNRLEDVVAQVYSERAGVIIKKLNGVLASVCLPPDDDVRFLGTPDRFIIDAIDTAVGILEIKTTSASSAKYWDEDKIPPHYYDQVQWYMGIAGIYNAEFAVLCGGNKYFTRGVKFDEARFAAMAAAAKMWWKRYIIDKVEIPSAQNGSGKTPRLFREDIAPIVYAYKDACDAVKQAQEDAEIVRKELDAALGDDTNVCCGMYNVQRIVCEGGFTIDSKALKNDAPEIFDKYKKARNGSTRIDVRLAF